MYYFVFCNSLGKQESRKADGNNRILKNLTILKIALLYNSLKMVVDFGVVYLY